MSDTAGNDHIPTAEIEADIADTEREISVLRKELLGYETFPFNSSEYRMAQLKASNRRIVIREGERLISDLRKILNDRKGKV